MKITLTPQQRPGPLDLHRAGDVLTLDGEAFDFSALPEGATLPAEAIASDFFAGPVSREGGELQLTLILPHGANAPAETLFPVPLEVTGNGIVDLPAYELPATDLEDAE